MPLFSAVSYTHLLPDPDTDSTPFVKLFTLFDKYDSCAVFYIGGNDSMDTIDKLSRYGDRVGSSEMCIRDRGYTAKEMKHTFPLIAADFANIPVTRVPKGKVGVVGEIYVKYSPLGNNDLQKFLESQDCEVKDVYKRQAQTLCGGFFAAKTDTCSQKVQPFEQKILFFSCKIDNTD